MPATALLPSFEDASAWVVRDPVPAFPAHRERDADGRVIREFDRPALEEICANMNRRERETGLPATLLVGHTRRWNPDSGELEPLPEKDLGPIVGYAREWHVAKFKGRLHAFYRPYYRPEQYATAMEHPYRSVEHWQDENIFEPIALLKRRPVFDMGAHTDGDPESTLADLPAPKSSKPVADGASLLVYEAGPRRRIYAMDGGQSMFSPASAAGSAGGELDYDEAFMQELLTEIRGLRADLQKMGAGGQQQQPTMNAAGGASGTSTGLPGTAGDDGPKMYSREAYQLQGGQLRDAQRKLRMYERAGKIRQLADGDDGLVLDVGEESARTADLDDAGFEAELARMVKCYARKGGGFIDTRGDRPAPGKNDGSRAEKAIAYATKHGVSYEEALAKV